MTDRCRSPPPRSLEPYREPPSEDDGEVWGVNNNTGVGTWDPTPPSIISTSFCLEDIVEEITGYGEHSPHG